MTQPEIHNLLVAVLGSKNVYFQPPSKQRIMYPAIVYSRAPYDITSADNHGYIIRDHYMITHMTKNPNSGIPKALAQMPYCRQEQAFKQDGLYHTVFSLYV